MPAAASAPPPSASGAGAGDVDAVRELNRLLESALRMGGGSADASAGAPGSVPPGGGGGDEWSASRGGGGSGHGNGGGGHHHGGLTSSEAASWRSDTARRLTSLLVSESPRHRRDRALADALRRQSRCWTPLLLGWLKGSTTGGGTGSGGDGSSSDFDGGSGSGALADQLGGGGGGGNGGGTGKARRRGDRKGGPRDASTSAGPPEVQIEALRALAALTEWTARGAGGDPPASASSYAPGGSSVDDAGGADDGRPSPHVPLAASSQRLLLRHADAVPCLASLLADSSDPSVVEHAAWMLGSVATGGLGGATIAASPARSADEGGSGDANVERATAMSEHEPAEGEGRVDDDGEGGGRDPPASSSSSNASGSGGGSGGGGSKKDPASVSARDAVLRSGAVPPLLRRMDEDPANVPLHRLGAWCLSGLVEGRYSSSTSASSAGGSSGSGGDSLRGGRGLAAGDVDVFDLLPTLRRMLYIDDAEVLTHACWTLSHLCDGPAYHIAAVIYSEDGYLPSASRRGRDYSPADGLVPRLVELLLHPSPRVAKPALRAVGNIVCADCGGEQTDPRGNPLPAVDFTEVVLECRAVPCLRRLVGHRNREIQKEACWTLSNIAAGTAGQIQAVIDSGAIPPLVELVNDERTDKEVRSEACWVVLNATSCGNDDQIAVLVEEGCVSVLGVLLAEPNMVMMALEGIERVLQTEEAQDSEDLYHRSEEELGQRPTIIRCAGLVKAVTESPHNSSAVAKRAKRIWDHHFVSCALCHNNYSRCRLRDSHFCNECKCHVCSNCDCRVYHLSYQEELWAEDEERAAETKKNKKSKKAKKKQKAKEKAEKKKLESQAQAEAQQQQQSKGLASKKEDAPAMASKQGETSSSKAEDARKESPDEGQPTRKGKKAKKAAAARKTSSSSPSRGTIESDTVSLGGGGTEGNANGDGDVSPRDEEEEGSEANSSGGGQPPIDLVLYLQQTGSIIALAKLMDSLYDNDEYEDEDDAEGGGERRRRQQPTPQGDDLNHRALTTQ